MAEMTPEVYFYATDSHSETSMQDFLKKINPNVKWISRSPRLAKRTKKDYAAKEIFPVLTGRTGVDLENFMIEEIAQHQDIVLKRPAILLEDDLDRRDALENQSEFLAARRKKLNDRISNAVEGSSAELICLYAAPEVETWLVEEWENSFGNSRLFNQQIATQLRPLINKIKAECGDSFESYSHYKDDKFSDWLSKHIQNLSEIHKIDDPEMASYSKRKHGSKFLGEIDPDKIAPKCRIYFAVAYHAIRKIV
jgi:hypothetical protein